MKLFIIILSEINDNADVNKLIESMGYSNNFDYKKFQK